MKGAPQTRTVCQLTGDRADRPSGGTERPSKFFQALDTPAPVDREMFDLVCTQRDKAIADRDVARAQLDATMQQLKDATGVAASLATSQAMWHAHFDEQRDRADEYAERCDAYLATIDELQAEVAELRGRVAVAESARDTANARASVG